MKNFYSISKGDLKKYDGKKCKADTEYGIIKGEVYVEDDDIYILHNNKKADGDCPDNMKGYSYSRRIYCNYHNDDTTDNDDYSCIEIEEIPDIKPTLKHNEVEVDGVVYKKVYVSDYSVEDALKNKEERISLATLPGNIGYKYICVHSEHEERFLTGKDYDTTNWKYIAEIEQPQEKKERKLILTDSEWEKAKEVLNIKE